jgi:hypothetical protein
MTRLLGAPGRRTWRVLAVTLAAGALLLPAAGAIAAFTGTTTTGDATYSTKRIYSHTATWSSWDVGDASAGGGEQVADDPLLAGDGLSLTTGGWPMAFDDARYIDIAYNSSLPPGLNISNANFRFTFASNGSSTSCLYAQLYRRSTMAFVAQTDPTDPICVAPGATRALSVVVVSFQMTTDLANDMIFRVVVRNDAGDGLTIDRATFDGNTPYSSVVLYRQVMTDTSASPATRPWSLVAADGTNFVPAATWTTAYSTDRYVRYTFPSYVPTGANVTAVTLHHAHRPGTAGVNTCYYFDVFSSGGTLLATHGGPGAPYCNSGAANVQDDISLPELTTGTAVNGFYIRMYWRVGSVCACTSLTDLLTVGTTYSLT